MTTPNDAAIQGIRDRLTGQVKAEERLGRSQMSDYDRDPFTRTDAIRDLSNTLEDDPDTAYTDLARTAGVEDTPAFRAAVDTGLDTEWAHRDDTTATDWDNATADGWDEAGHQAWLDDMGHVSDTEGDVQ